MVGFRVRVLGLEFAGLWFRDPGSGLVFIGFIGFRVWGLGFKGLGFRGLGFRV